jgi:hypothetical protein
MSLTLGDLSGLRKINLVGREKILEEIHRRGEDAENKKRSALIYLEGKGVFRLR